MNNTYDHQSTIRMIRRMGVDQYRKVLMERKEEQVKYDQKNGTYRSGHGWGQNREHIRKYLAGE